MLVFIDETGSDRRDAIRRFWYSLRGYPCIRKKLLARGCHTSAISVLSSQGILDVQFVRGGVNYDKFLDFVEKSLILHLLPFDGVNPNSVMGMDNAIIHNHAGVQELISSIGALLVYLPPYSPVFSQLLPTLHQKTALAGMNTAVMECNSTECITCCRVQLILHRISPSVCIYVCVTLRNVTLRNAILRQACVQDGVIPVTWMPPLYFWRMKD